MNTSKIQQLTSWKQMFICHTCI